MYDFAGWATKNDVRCSDGRIIRQDAFKECDGKTVPLVWNHDHNNPDQVLGHADLENRATGVYAYCSFNDTTAGKNAKELVKHGDVVSLSIYANRLKQKGSEVLHGAIREVSLVLAGANPGALIESVITHGELSEEEAVIYTGESLSLSHAGEDAKELINRAKTDDSSKGDDMPNNQPDNATGGKTVKDVFDSLTDEQKKVVYFLIGSVVEKSKGGNGAAAPDDDEEDVEHSDFYDGGNMKYNLFSDEGEPMDTLSHAETAAIFADAKRGGSLKDAVLEHGIEQIDWLFPEAKNLENPPAWITKPQEWVSTVMNGVSHSPFSRVKTQFANLTEDEARARGYIKGNRKKEQVFSLLKRSIDPQTVYKLQKLDRDDIIDITDFDVVSWIKGEMRGQLDWELARAYLIGDGRETSDDDKIFENHIQPIWTDHDLFTIHALMTLPTATTVDQKAKAFIRSCIKARKNYKGSGNPVLFTTEDMLTDMLLLEDQIGHIIYDSEAKLATALRVSKIVTVPDMENLTRSVDGTTRTLDGIIVNLSDYRVGADKGGAVNMFDDFDIDYNKYAYLIETRCSGALIKPFSAITIESVIDNNATTITFAADGMVEAFVNAYKAGYTTHRAGTVITDEFEGTGSKTTFTLTHTPAYDDLDAVTVDGTTVTTGFSVSGTTLTFTTAPASGKEVTATYHYIG